MTEKSNKIEVGNVYESANDGKFVIVRYSGAHEILVRFLATGYEKIVRSDHIKKGTIKDKLKPVVFGVGYLGVDHASISFKGVKTPAYRVWLDMMRRCYDETSRTRSPTYHDCTVCDEWHSFANFEKWFSENYKPGLALDKDTVITGNRTYSPEGCVFITSKENTIAAKAKSYSFINPDGKIVEVYNLREFCKVSNLHAGHMCQVHLGNNSQHKGWRKNIREGDHAKTKSKT